MGGCTPSKPDASKVDRSLTGVGGEGDYSDAPLLGKGPEGKLQDFGLKFDATEEQKANADIVISVPLGEDIEINNSTLLRDTDSTSVNPLHLKRVDLIKRLSRGGLMYSSMKSADGDEAFLIIDCTEERLMEAAEFSKFEMRLKKSWQVPYAKFTIARKDDFVHEDRANNRVFSTRDRQILIMRILETGSLDTVDDMVVNSYDNMIWKGKYGKNKTPTCGLNLDDWVSEGVLNGYWAMHGHGRRYQLVDNWASFRHICSWTQPLKMIFEYFNSKTALYFAFVGYYSAWLAVSAFFGVACEVYAYVQPQEKNKNGVTKLDNNEMVTIFAFFMALWGTLFIEFWKRYNSELAYRWSTIDLALEASERSEFSNGTGGLTRQGFYAFNGEFVPYDEDLDYSPECGHGDCGLMFTDPVDEDVDAETKQRISEFAPPAVPYMDQATQSRRMCFNFGVAIFFTAAVISILMSFLVMRLIFQKILDAKYGAIAASTLQALVTVGLNVVYKELAIIMVDYENHRTDDQWENAIINKVFGFQFINSYFSLFYIAFLKGKIGDLSFPGGEPYSDQCKDSHGNPSDNCMLELSTLLLSTLLTTQIASTIAEALLPYVQYQALLRAEQAKWKMDGNEGELQLSDIDHESKLTPAYKLDAFNDYNKMAIQFGYVSMFVAAFPLAPLCALANNLLEIRTDAMKRLQGMQRPAPSERAEDIGAWLNILELMSLAAVATNIGVLCFTSNKLATDFKLTGEQRVWTFVIMEHIVVCVKLFMAGSISDRPDWVTKRLARDEYMLNARDEHIEKEELDALKAEEDLKKIGGVTLETDGAKAPMSSTK